MSLVTFRPIGRLGNNLFQTAACIGYAKKYGMQWAIPSRRGAGDTFEGQPTPWLLPQFWPNLPVTHGGLGARYEQHQPEKFNYAPIPHFPQGVTLVGFFQSEKWFENAKEEVKAALPLKDYPEYYGYVSVHVRRGDYVANANSFPPVTTEYCAMALQEIKKRSFISDRCLIFSDDIQWCKDNFKTEGVELQFNQDTNEYEALSKMASCSHHIIANSSFSWWGAWLGHNPNKIVVSPHHENWFGQNWTAAPPKDVIPDNWIQIKFR